MHGTKMRDVDTVFNKFLRMAVNVPNRVSYTAPVRFITSQRLNLPWHLSGGAMPHENGTVVLADLEKTQARRRRRGTRRRVHARTFTENRKP